MEAKSIGLAGLSLLFIDSLLTMQCPVSYNTRLNIKCLLLCEVFFSCAYHGIQLLLFADHRQEHHKSQLFLQFITAQVTSINTRDLMAREINLVNISDGETPLVPE